MNNAIVLANGRKMQAKNGIHSVKNAGDGGEYREQSKRMMS
jgi:uncharacterized protein YegP (UPF0339 family)